MAEIAALSDFRHKGDVDADNDDIGCGGMVGQWWWVGGGDGGDNDADGRKEVGLKEIKSDSGTGKIHYNFSD